MDLRRLDWILKKAQDADLSDFEEKFVRDMTERRERQGDALVVTERQEEVLEQVAEKV